MARILRSCLQQLVQAIYFHASHNVSWKSFRTGLDVSPSVRGSPSSRPPVKWKNGKDGKYNDTRDARARARARIQMRWKFPPDRSSQRIRKKSRFCPRARGTSEEKEGEEDHPFLPFPSLFLFLFLSFVLSRGREFLSSSSFGVARSKFIHAQRRKFSADFRPSLKVPIFFDTEMYFYFLSFSSFTQEINPNLLLLSKN